MSVSLIKRTGRHHDIGHDATADLYHPDQGEFGRTYEWFVGTERIIVPVAWFSTGARHAVSA